MGNPSLVVAGLQKITATTIGLSPVLICTANATGGVLGKMINAQSICVATAATEKVGTEADLFKWVLWHSVVLAALIGGSCCSRPTSIRSR